MNENTKILEVEQLLKWSIRTYGNKVKLATAFGAEGMVLIDILSKLSDPDKPRIFTLDTGRLPNETYQLIDTVRRRYKLNIEVYFPDAAEVEKMVYKHGIDLFYGNPDLRKLCCSVRKVHPLERALRDADAWITGLRRGQSSNRKSVQIVSLDDQGKVKLCPLAEWSNEEIWNYIQRNHVPYNRLHDEGYTSIGCAPCSRASRSREDPRNGRWWWESNCRKECGLHA